jgi:eukaryotic-like serine/threonine-protein kinase
VDPSVSSSGSLLPSSDGSLPARIGGYRVLRRLATGGTSDVLLARAEGPHGFERVVVLKLLLQQYRDDKSFERMFAREAAAYARLSHPAIVKLFDFFSDAGQLVMVLEHVDGLPLHKLRALLKPMGLAFDDRAAMFVAWRIFGALAAAHSAKDPQSGALSPVIHRDVNPSNVLIPWDGHVKIADFGIAKVGGVDGDKTQAGFIKGTYGYMAPEQVRGEAVTVRADVYAGCLLLWELLTGRKAIVRGSMSDLDVLRAMAEPVFPSLAALRPDLPRSLLEAVAKGLQPDPNQRTIQAEELASALRAAFNLDDGRQRLVDTLAAVRTPAVTEDSGATARPPAVSLPDSSADATIPNPVVLLRDATALLEKAPLPAVRPPTTPPVAVPRPIASLVSTLRMASMRAVAPRGATARPPAKPSTAPPPASARPPATLRTPAPPPPAPAALLRTPAPPPSTPAPPPPTPRTPAPPGVPPAPARPRSAPPAPAWTAPAFAPGAYPSTPTYPYPPAAPLPVAHVAPSSFAPPAPASPVAWTPTPPRDDALPFPRSRSRAGIAVLASILALAACAGVAFVLWPRTRPRPYAPPAVERPAARQIAPPAAPPPSTPPAPAASPAPVASATGSAGVDAPAPPASSGTVTVAPAHGGHRVWIDKHMVGESPGTFPVGCGWHSVQIGSQGDPQRVHVPCGGDVEMR